MATRSPGGAGAPRPVSPSRDRDRFPALALSVLMVASLVSVAMFYRQPQPLPADSGAELFSEERALSHARALESIPQRWVGSAGLTEGIDYIEHRCLELAELVRRTRPDLEASVARRRVTGGLLLRSFRTEFSNAYFGLTNVELVIEPKGGAAGVDGGTEVQPGGVGERDPLGSAPPAPLGVLLNAHVDAALGSSGGSDDAAQVGVLLEAARAVVEDPSRPPPGPLVFLFNGGEETFMQAAHGFLASPARERVGALLNLESTGSGGPDVLFQSTRDWTVRSYARAAPHLRANAIMQDLFDAGLIPADTDFRVLAGRGPRDLPGVDSASILGADVYHTNRDLVERIRPGTVQAAGENALAGARAIGEELAAGVPASPGTSSPGERIVAFDILGLIPVLYSYRTADALHSLPLAALALAALHARLGLPTAAGLRAPARATVTAAARAYASVALAVGSAVAFAFLRVGVLGSPLRWYARPWLGLAVLLPPPLLGCLLPYLLGRVAREPEGRRALRIETLGSAWAWAVPSALLSIFAGLYSTYGGASWGLATALSLALLGDVGEGGAGGAEDGDRPEPPGAGAPAPPTRPRDCGRARAVGLLTLAAAALPFALPAALVAPVNYVSWQHVGEKVGMAGNPSGWFGAFNGDVVFGAITGVVTASSLGTLTPSAASLLRHRFGSGRRAAGTLLALSLAASVALPAIAPANPFTSQSPKRLMVIHLHELVDGVTRGGPGAPAPSPPTISRSVLGVVTPDSTGVEGFLPPALAALPRDEDFGIRELHALYPFQSFTKGVGLTAPVAEMPEGTSLPTLGVGEPEPAALAGHARVPLRIRTGGRGCWGSLIVSGPVAAWSLSDPTPAPVRASGGGEVRAARFSSAEDVAELDAWLELPRGSNASIHLFVTWSVPVPDTASLAAHFPDWTSPATLTAFSIEGVLQA